MKPLCPTEIEKASESSPAIERYLNLVKITQAEGFPEELRIRRHREWIQHAGASLLRPTQVKEICQSWSKVADEFIRLAWSESQLDNLGVGIFALGKLGAQELNLSSDIDLIFVSEDRANQEALKAQKHFMQTLSSVTNLGFCFRVDIDLRPGGRFGPPLVGLKQFEDYYWSQAEPWERLALVRLRTICAPESLEKSVTRMAKSYCYRRFLDFTLWDELQALRQKIHKFYPEADLEIDLKLGVGGIRDIELFTHALQIIHGGKQLSLQTHSTDGALDQLYSLQVLPEKSAIHLKNFYWRLRSVENQIQAQEDQQTHIWNTRGQESCFVEDESSFRLKMLETDKIVSELLGSRENSEESIDFPHLEEVLQLGFSPKLAQSLYPEMKKASALSQHRLRDERARAKMVRGFLISIAKFENFRERGLKQFVDFLKVIRAKSTMFSLFAKNPQAISEVAQLLTLSGYIGDALIRRPELIDSVVFRTRTPLPEQEGDFYNELTEFRMLGEVLAAQHFINTLDAQTLTLRLSDLADEICLKLLEFLKKSLKLNSELRIFALGKWGGKELGLGSDLDLVFVCPNKVTPADSKLARRFLSRLNDLHRGGQIYQVDLRLRMSGGSGPLIVSLASLNRYLTEEAHAWEKQAYLRARDIQKNGGLRLSPDFLLLGLTPEDEVDLASVRTKLIKQNSQSSIDVKYSAGGLIETELILQQLLLKCGSAPKGPSLREMILHLCQEPDASQERLKRIEDSYSFLRAVEQLVKFFTGKTVTHLDRSQEVYAQLSSWLQKPTLLDEVEEILRKNSSDLNKLIKNSEHTPKP